MALRDQTGLAALAEESMDVTEWLA